MNSYLLKSAIVAALGGLLFGFDTAVIAGATGALSAKFALTPAMLGVTVSSALWGTILGAMFGGIPGDRYGRRASLQITAVLYLVSALGCALAFDWYSFLLARFIGGLGIGASSVLGPMYIAEIAPADKRGRLVGFFQFNIVFGILLAYFSNYLVGTMSLGDAEWRWKLGIPGIPAALFSAMLFSIPESPRWLARRGRMREARGRSPQHRRSQLPDRPRRDLRVGGRRPRRAQRAAVRQQIQVPDLPRRLDRDVQPVLRASTPSSITSTTSSRRRDSPRSRATCRPSPSARPTSSSR